ERALSHSPLFQAMLILQNAPGAAPRLPGLRARPFTVGGEGTKFDLTLAFMEAEQRIAGQVEYNRDLFEAATMERLAAHFQALLAAAAADPALPAGDLDLLAAGERWQLLGEWNDTAADFPADPADSLLHEHFAAQAARTPATVALIAGDESLTYRELDVRANRLAHRLRALGVGPEVRVGIAMERTADLLVGLLAILKAGGAYVPLDPAYPRERLAFILADAQEGIAEPVLLIQERLLDRLPGFRGRALCVDREREAIAGESAAAPPDEVLPGNLAYMIYTSGSTGRPKGVAIEHRSACALLHWASGVFTAEQLAGVLAATSITFDLSIFEIFLPLARGGTVILAADALALADLPAAAEVTLVNTVPSAIAELLRLGAIPASVATVNLAGEPLKRALVDRLHERPQIEAVYNLYGPSEDTTYSTFTRVPRGAAAEPTIGIPVAGTRAYVLDRRQRALPIGVPGELLLGGAGLARGYLNRPDLTAASFVPDPFGGAGERLYRTGDLARRLSDGQLEFLGRIDHQVKVRGFRIELGEIEVTLLAHPGVREAVVLAREDAPGAPGDQRLVAYAVAAEAERPPSGADLRAHLAERLPEHMIPAAFVVLPALPLLPNGKVDRKALPAPEQEGAGAAGYDAPRGPMEELLAGIWSELLRVGRVGIHDSFFALGGHSLLATQVMSRVREVLGVEVPLRRLFEAPTVAGLAAQVERAQEAKAAGRGERRLAAPPLVRRQEEGHSPASFPQERLWFLDQLGVGGAAYHLPNALRLSGRLDRPALAAALNELVRRHESLRTTFSTAGADVVQVVAPPLAVALPVVDLSALPTLQAAEAESERLLRDEARRPFDLERGPLFRSGLLRLAETEHVLLLTMHHIVSDGWSLGVLTSELSALYGAFSRGEGDPLPALQLHYADYAVWQREVIGGEVLQAQ
ncbi:MAG TPA: amino acid adenylation domain-containing protein, partial [Thermoanaerobaculia bacterium]|nr:amino acid adenylation domain-containing protein [Thermoanaerobaculia bacterium]